MTGQGDRHVVAVVGDGALTGGMTWEALNNISDDNTRNLVVVVNDNGRSYAPTIGGMARFLNSVRTRRSYRDLLQREQPGVRPARRARRRVLPRRARRPARLPQPLHRQRGALLEPRHQVHRPDRRARPARDGGGAPRRPRTTARRSSCTRSPRRAAATSRPCATSPTSSTPSARSTPRPASRSRPPRRPSWTERLRRRARAARRASDRRLVGITAAMLRPDRPAPHGRAFPDRVFDVGIAEQHAVTSAAGLAFGGLHPVVARLRDVHEPRLRPGADGCRAAQARASPSCSTAPASPGPTARATTACGTSRSCRSCPASASPRPRDARAARARSSARPSPSTTRPPSCASRRAPSAPSIDAVRRLDDGVDVLAESERKDVLLVTVGPMAAHRPRGRAAPRGAGHRRHRRRPALGRAGAAQRHRASRPSTASSSASRTASASAASARASGRTSARRASTRR